MHGLARFFSVHVWGKLPGPVQRKISQIWGKLYDSPFSRYLIKPYSYLSYKNSAYLEQFRSETGSNSYRSFQDFFIRVYKKFPAIEGWFIWPCEGFLCDYGKVEALPPINVKGDRKNIRTIFGKSGQNIPDHYYFVNIFLHTKNYHRLHSPVNATIKAVEHISGDLVLLRPWVYKQEPSLPAMRNERFILLMENKNYWYLAIVGGPGIGTIVLNPHIRPGTSLKPGEEIGKFLIGSTCCIAMPHTLNHHKVGDIVPVGQAI